METVDIARTYWVEQELVAAHTGEPRIPWVEIREEGVISPGGMLDAFDAQRIDYRPEDRAACLVYIAQAVKRFHDLTRLTMIRLGPAATAEQISPWLEDATFACTYETLRGGKRVDSRSAPVFLIRGGVFVHVRGIAAGELVRITITARGRIWRSHYESVDTVDVQVKE